MTQRKALRIHLKLKTKSELSFGSDVVLFECRDSWRASWGFADWFNLSIDDCSTIPARPATRALCLRHARVLKRGWEVQSVFETFRDTIRRHRIDHTQNKDNCFRSPSIVGFDFFLGLLRLPSFLNTASASARNLSDLRTHEMRFLASRAAIS